MTAHEIGHHLDHAVPAPMIGTILADGTHALIGPDGKPYYEHFDGNRPIWDRPVPEDKL